MVTDGPLDNPGLCFEGTFMSAEHHSAGKEPSTPTEKCVFLSRCRLVTGKVGCPRPYSHTEGK